jgi:hypothetical protein
MTENETKNTGSEKVGPTYSNLEFKLDTGIPNIEPKVEPEPGAESGDEPPVTRTLPYQSSKQPTMETKYRLDKRTNRLSNSETMKYRDTDRGGDSDEDYIPEPELRANSGSGAKHETKAKHNTDDEK